jgi:hypothetical protein
VTGRVTAAGQLLDRLGRHYVKPAKGGGIFLTEVGTNDWNAAGRRCDAIYVGFTSASGKLLVGHEAKVSRSDWLRELDEPGKADFWHDNCHAWYVVAPDSGVVRPEEVPHGWGLLLPNPRSEVRMDVVVKAAVREDLVPSWTAVRSVMARYDTLRAAAIRDAARDEVAALREQHEKQLTGLREGRRPEEPLDPDVAWARQLLDELRPAMQRAELWASRWPDRAMIIDAVVDVQQTRAAAGRLRVEISNRIAMLRQACSPIADSLLRLEQLVNDDPVEAAREAANVP